MSDPIVEIYYAAVHAAAEAEAAAAQVVANDPPVPQVVAPPEPLPEALPEPQQADIAPLAGHALDHSDKLLLHVQQLFLSHEFADVLFHIGPDVVYAHKAVISASPGLIQLAANETDVYLEDIHLMAFKELLRYLYTGRLAVGAYGPQMLAEVTQLAEHYELPALAEALAEEPEVLDDNEGDGISRFFKSCSLS